MRGITVRPGEQEVCLPTDCWTNFDKYAKQLPGGAPQLFLAALSRAIGSTAARRLGRASHHRGPGLRARQSSNGSNPALTVSRPAQRSLTLLGLHWAGPGAVGSRPGFPGSG